MSMKPNLQIRKEELQTAISRKVAKLVESFKADTGVSPVHIDIEMLPVRALGRETEYIVGEASVELDL